MSRSSVNLRNFILGLLTQQPMSGYDIKRVLENLGWLVGKPSFGSLYPALHALLEDGLVTVKTDERPDKPSRKIYTISTAGRRALDDWVNQPAESNTSMKAFVMRLIVADSFSHTGLVAQLHQRRAQVAAHRAALERAAESEDHRESTGAQLAFDFGRALASTELTWLDSTLDRLFQVPLPTEAMQSD